MTFLLPGREHPLRAYGFTFASLGIVVALWLLLGQPGWWLAEAGPLELGSVLAYLCAFVGTIVLGGPSYWRRYAYLAVVPLFLGMREFDLRAILAAFGVDYPNYNPNLVERGIAAALVLTVGGLTLWRHGRQFFGRFRENLAINVGIVLIALLAAVSLLTDRYNAMVAPLLPPGLDLGPILALKLILEETAELGVAVLMLQMFLGWLLDNPTRPS